MTAAWHAAEASCSAQVLGPHFEHLARVWAARFSGDRWGTPVGEVGPAVVNDSKGRSQHELDVVALPRGRRRHDGKAPIVVIGEAKATTKRREPGGDAERPIIQVTRRITHVPARRDIHIVGPAPPLTKVSRLHAKELVCPSMPRAARGSPR
ncbi:hypothetical protein UQW22_07870 [Isoptericola halotolerans]|uniref:hypothetical protein n=1 Tax=Isoptericola halotolerans TaxID=300560 RepID=UPI00388DED3D